MTAGETGPLRVLLKAITYEAEDVISLDLRPAAGKDLPPFTAGAHIELRLPNGLIRHYSLLNSQDERHRYCVAVQKESLGRGGSRFVHEAMKAGDIIEISAPKNNFQLVEDAPHTILIAGGIGITPIWSMVQRLVALRKSWQLFYAVRKRGRAAFVEHLMAAAGNEPAPVHFHFDDESAAPFMDIPAILKDAPPGTHFYCCGPSPMLGAFERAAGDLPPAQVHVEYFASTALPDTSGGFQVILAKSKRTIPVPENMTILRALLNAGIRVDHSCLEGVCGTCETTVLEGVPDHRDAVLSRQERDSNRTMMICCSGSKSPELVLDL